MVDAFKDEGADSATSLGVARGRALVWADGVGVECVGEARAWAWVEWGNSMTRSQITQT
jgi:hypothetical protein